MRNLIVHAYQSRRLPENTSVCSCYKGEGLQEAILATLHGGRITVEQHSDQNDETGQVLGTCDAPELEPGVPDKFIGMHFLEEEDQLCLLMHSGDILLLTLGKPAAESIEVVGSIDAVIEAAAWSPDGDVLCLATAQQVSFLTRSFETLAQVALAETDLKQSANQVSVGWGRAETQFRGKHAPRDPTLPEKIDAGVLSPFEDSSMTLSWRGDGQSIAHTSVCAGRRVVRVYAREGLLESTSEAVDGQEGALSWKPSGAVIASVQRQEDALNLIFFEKNGLRHGEFSLRCTAERPRRVQSIAWNCDGSVLAVLYEAEIEFWTASNYHYSLKAQFDAPDASALLWHPEKPFLMHLLTQEYCLSMEFSWDTIIQKPALTDDFGLVCMIDGNQLGLTPVKVANVPPPMSLMQLQLDAVPRHVSISNDAKRLWVLFADRVDLYRLDVPARRVGTKIGSMPLESDVKHQNLQIFESRPDTAVVLRSSDMRLVTEKSPEMEMKSLPISKNTIGLRHLSSSDVILQDCYGELQCYLLDATPQRQATVQFPEVCQRFDVAAVDADCWIAFGLSDKGKLYAASRRLASGVTSFLLLPTLLAYTTSTHIHFIHLADSPDALELVPEGGSDERSRQIDRGSLLICACPTADSVTLQAPRGNLETVFPRLLVLSGIRKAIDAGSWRHAWQKAKLHRIDFNILCDYAPERFDSQMDRFVAALETSTELDLFLSALKAENVTTTLYRSTLPSETQLAPAAQPDKVARICNAMLALLEDKYRATHLTSILTAHLAKQPADHEAALMLVSALPEGEQDEALTHMCFLADPHQLYQRALGLYDLKLALLLAQRTQKDPREYVPFLQNIQRQEVLRQRFMLDDYLEKYDKAVRSLLAMPFDAVWPEALRYIRMHLLWSTALACLRDSRAHYLVAVAEYAKDLHERRDMSEAGAAFELVDDQVQASACYALAGQWQESLQCAVLAQLDVQDLAARLAGDLVERSRFADAAQVHRDWLADPDAAIALFGRAFDFGSAFLLAGTRERIDQLVKPSLREGFSQLSSLLAEMRAQLEAQIPRLAEVREKRRLQPEAFFDAAEGDEAAETSGAPDNVSLAGTDATSSTQHSVFTRYTDLTGASGSTSMSRRSGKAKRRMERQRARGKKGTIWEEEYLVGSIRRLMERLESNVRLDARKLIVGLIRGGMLVEAGEVQKAAVATIRLALDSMDEVFVGILTLPQELQRTMGERPTLNVLEVATLVAS